MRKIISVISIFILYLYVANISYAMNSWQFKVFYGDQEIGEHYFKVENEGDNRKVSIEADFNVDVLFINVYSYKHKNTEIWKDSCLSSIESSTDDNGDKYSVSGQVSDEVLKIESNLGKEEVEGCVNTFAYWDKNFLESDYLLNSQTGEVVETEVSFISDEKIVVQGKLINTSRYELKTDEFTIDLWYSDNDRWVALNSTTRDGTTLRYQMK